MVRAATLLALLSASCVSSSSTVCEDGSTCPGGFVCDVDNARCLLPEQVSACSDKLEGDECAFSVGAGACREGACINFFCGDGYVTAGEDCEGDNLVDTTCKDFGFYDLEGLSCSSSCTFDLGDSGAAGTEVSGCYLHEYCGDDTTNGPELCDGPEQRTCVSIGFDAGTTSCNLQCGFSIGDCSRFGWNPESLSDVVALAIAGTAHDDQWAFGVGGRAMRFEGAFWNTVPTGVPNDLVNGWAVATTDAWAVGLSNTNPLLPSVVMRWNGTQWSTVTNVPAAGEYLDVWGPAANEIYVASTTGIHKLAGTAWSTVAGFTGTPKAIRGSSGSDIWVSTVEGPLQHFTGSAWEDLSPPSMVVEFLDVNTATDVWAIGYKTGFLGTGMIAHYTGTWRTWETPSETYNVVASSAPNDTWVGGSDGIMRHWDGIAWARSANIGSSPTGLTALSGMLSLGPGEVVAVSTLNLAYRYRGQAFGVFQAISTNPFDAPQNTAVWGTAANNQYVVNVKGEIWHFDGVAWVIDFTIPADAPANDIWGTAADDIWVAANDGNAYHYDGVDWTPFAVTGVPLHRVWADPSGDVWAFSAAGAFHKEGANWAHTPLEPTGSVASVSGSGPTNLWVVQTSPSSVWRYDGTWTQMSTGAVFPELAVAAVSPTDVHVTAEQGRFMRFDGAAWTESVLPVLADLRFISYTADDDVVAASERDLAHFNGTSWSTMRTPVDFVPNTADYLPIVDLHATPGRIDMLQQKFRIRTLIRTRPLLCRQDEICGDSVDNDCDELLDDLDVSECP